MRSRRATVLLLAAWVLTRVALIYVTAHDHEGPYRGTTPAANDIELYEFWAGQVDAGERPYEDFALEYPPANLPFMVGPHAAATAAGRSYEMTFLVMAAAIDGLAFAGLLVLGQRGRSLAGPVAWLVFVPLLGPVALSRLDVVPAAAFVWALVLARQRRWTGAGAALGVAAGTKVFAGLLLPVWAAATWSKERVTRLAVGAAVVVAVPLLVFVDVASDLIDDVWGYHSGRGVAMESSWGSLLLAGERLAGRTATIELRSGAWEVVNSNGSTLKTVATLSVVAVVAYATLLAWRQRELAIPALATLSAGVVVSSVGLGNIFSAQYVLWCVAAVAAAAAAGARVTVPLAMVGVAAAATHVLYPIWFFDLLTDQDATSIGLLLARNALVVGAGVLLLRSVATGGASTSDPGVEQEQPVPVLAGDGGPEPEREVDDAGRDDDHRDQRGRDAPQPA